MNYLPLIAYFVGGAFFTNAIPHLVSGVLGRAFQSPFANPPGKGLSSSTVNVLWGAFNLAMSYLLVLHIGAFELRSFGHVLALGAGGLLMGLFSARYFGQLHGGNSPE
ncbi:MAG: hypothetical protein ACRYFZ_04730 [Janthinobacterium lividum]